MTTQFNMTHAKTLRAVLSGMGGTHISLPDLGFPVDNMEVAPCVIIDFEEGLVERVEEEDGEAADFWSLYVHTCDPAYAQKFGPTFCIADFKRKEEAFSAAASVEALFML